MTIRHHIADWREQFQRYRSEHWFRKGLPAWAVKILDLPPYDKKSSPDWWEVADAMIQHTYKSERYRENYLGSIMKSPTTGEPLTDRLARQALKGRFVGQAPKE